MTNMNNNAINELKLTRRLLDVGKYNTSTGETVYLRHFDEVELNHVRDLTPEKVSYIEDRYWAPDGFIAWNIVDEELQLVYFKGKAAIVTIIKVNDLTRELLNRAMSLSNLGTKTVVYSSDMYACA